MAVITDRRSTVAASRIATHFCARWLTSLRSTAYLDRASSTALLAIRSASFSTRRPCLACRNMSDERRQGRKPITSQRLEADCFQSGDAVIYLRIPVLNEPVDFFEMGLDCHLLRQSASVTPCASARAVLAER